MESLKYYPDYPEDEGDGAIDAVDRDDVRMAWGNVDGRRYDVFDVKPGPRYENVSVGEHAGRRKIEIRPENVRDFGNDRAEENIEMLEEIGNEQMVDLYKKVIEDYPQLCVIKLLNDDKSSASFRQLTRDTTTGQIIPTIRFNFSHSEVYRLNTIDTLSSKNDDLGKTASIKYAMKMVALRTGADWEDCARNKRMAASLAFLHEMGHAHDFIDNYLVPEYSDRAGMPDNKRMADSVAMASDMMEEAKASEETYHMEKVGDPFERWYRLHQKMSHEVHADNFATDYLTDHYDDFFIVEEKPDSLKEAAGAKAKEALKKFAYGEDRVRVHFGREVPMDEDFAHLMGMNAGNRIKVEPVYVPEKEPSRYDMKDGDFGLYGYENAKRYDADGNYIANKHAPKQVYEHERISGEGEAVSTLREGAPLYLRVGPEQESVRICDCTVGVRYVPSRDPETGKVENKVLFNDKANRTFRVERLSD